MIIELTDKERQLVGFYLACAIEDTEKQLRKFKKDKDSLAVQQLAQIQRITYTKFIPESLSGDWVLADGTTLFKEGK